MELFNAYSEEFTSLTNNVEQKLMFADTLPLLSEIETKFTEVQDCLKQLEIEAAGIRGSEKKLVTEKVTTYREQFRSLKKKIADKKFNIENKDLMGSKSGEDRLRMKKANDKLVDSNEQLTRALATVAEIEETAVTISTELTANTERLKATKEKTEEFNGIMDPAIKTLKRMDRRRWTLGFF